MTGFRVARHIHQNKTFSLEPRRRRARATGRSFGSGRFIAAEVARVNAMCGCHFNATLLLGVVHALGHQEARMADAEECNRPVVQ
jgi:hypothetical protein